MKLTFCAISDTHNKHEKLEIPDTDMILHAGDSTGRGTTREIEKFCQWYGSLPHKHKILIAGNHDWGFEKERKKHQKIAEDNGIIYLQDSGCEIDGIKIHGSPQSPEFCNWAFNCWRFEAQEKHLDKFHGGYDWIKKYWDLIPEDTDILLTHGPPHAILDRCPHSVGCVELRDKILEVKPEYHIFGHIHEDRGVYFDGDTRYLNVSSLDECYYPYNKKIEVYTVGG